MSLRIGFGAQTGETEAGTPTYENGTVTVTGAARDAALEHPESRGNLYRGLAALFAEKAGVPE